MTMSNKNNHYQEYATPTEASKDMREWNDSSYQTNKTHDEPCGTRQDDEEKNGSHVHFMLYEDDGKTIKNDDNGKTDIVEKIYWPNDNN